MRDNMLKIPGAPSNSDEGDLYENIETRTGTTDKQKEAGSQYSVIDKDGHVDLVNWMGDQAGGYQNNHYKSHELLLEKIASPEDLAKIGHALKKRDQFFNLIGISATGFVLSLTYLY